MITRPMLSLIPSLLLLAAPVQAGVVDVPLSQLARARAALAAADTNGDGSLDAAELRAAGVPGPIAAANDANADGRISEGEFLVFYRGLLTTAGRAVGPDLEHAVADVLRSRREAADRARKEREVRRAEIVTTPAWARPRVAEEARARIERAQAALSERPRRTVGRPVDLPTTPAVDLRIRDAREHVAEVRDALQERGARLAALRNARAVGEELVDAPVEAVPAADPRGKTPVEPATRGAVAAEGARKTASPAERAAAEGSVAKESSEAPAPQTPAPPPPGPVVETDAKP